MNKFLFASLVLAVLAPAASHAQVRSGRYQDDGNAFSVELRGGMLRLTKGEVKETRRAYDNGDQADYSAFLSDYNFEELGFDEDYPTIGLRMEKQWRFFTFELTGEYASPTAEAVAKMQETASDVPANRRGYYIGVEEVEFNGQSYEYMFIPDGTPFQADIQAGIAEMKFKFTPFHIEAGPLAVSPWIHAGIFAAGGSYTIDAGPAQGVIEYEDPPKEYVVRGEGTGSAALAMPEVGAGGEVRWRLKETAHGDAALLFNGDVSVMQFDGAPGNVGINVESTRNVDLHYLAVEVGVTLLWPLSEHVDMFAGAGYRVIQSDVTLDSIHRSEEEQEELSEKYDKYAEFALAQWVARIGLRF
jgi:hypothetical protein